MLPICLPFLSIIISDCIEKGKDYNAGGARYNTDYIQGVGIGTITDSLSAIKYHVFDHKNINMKRLKEVLKDNFDGHEEIRQLFLNKTPKYGNDDDCADDIMKFIMKLIFNAFYQEVDGRKTPKVGFTGLICFLQLAISILVQ